jgi:2-dehydropantoate 2-reductase
MGSFFGGMMKGAGLNVTLIDLDSAHLQAMATRGLSLTVDGLERIVHPRAVLPWDAEGSFDIVLVFTKTMHSAAALRGIAQCIGPATRLISLQNGLGNDRALLAHVPPERAFIGVTTYPADLHGPGCVSSAGAGKVRLAPRAPAATEDLAALFAHAGLALEVDPGIDIAIWEKVAFNAALNPLCAVTRHTVGAVGAQPDSRALAFEVVEETCRTAHAAGIAVDRERIRETLSHALLHHRAHKPSMLQDIEASRPTEIEAITGGIVAQAEALGIETPVCRTLLRLVRHIEMAQG